jgi:hypothetical protein
MTGFVLEVVDLSVCRITVEGIVRVDERVNEDFGASRINWLDPSKV